MHQRLLDVLQSCQAIGQYTAGLDIADYERDPMVRDAVELTPDLGDRLPELREIVGLRNRIIHGYHAVDNKIIWDVVQNELPFLQRRVEALLGEDEPR